MLNCGLRQHNFHSLPWVAHAGAERTWHGRGRAQHEQGRPRGTTAVMQPSQRRGTGAGG